MLNSKEKQKLTLIFYFKKTHNQLNCSTRDVAGNCVLIFCVYFHLFIYFILSFNHWWNDGLTDLISHKWHKVFGHIIFFFIIIVDETNLSEGHTERSSTNSYLFECRIGGDGSVSFLPSLLCRCCSSVSRPEASGAAVHRGAPSRGFSTVRHGVFLCAKRGLLTAGRCTKRSKRYSADGSVNWSRRGKCSTVEGLNLEDRVPNRSHRKRPKHVAPAGI